jgi:hypothetical protein
MLPAGVLSVIACLQQLRFWWIMGDVNIMQQHFIPPDATVAELEQKAADADGKANSEPEARAAELREQAKLYREWAASLRSGRWTS